MAHGAVFGQLLIKSRPECDEHGCRQEACIVFDVWECLCMDHYEARLLAGKVYEDIRAERSRQDEQWGGADHDDDHGGEDWIEFIDRFLVKAVPYTMGSEDWYDGMLKAAALCVAALEAHGRRYGGSDG